jgi:hypothetical protein
MITPCEKMRKRLAELQYKKKVIDSVASLNGPIILRSGNSLWHASVISFCNKNNLRVQDLVDNGLVAGQETLEYMYEYEIMKCSSCGNMFHRWKYSICPECTHPH